MGDAEDFADASWGSGRAQQATTRKRAYTFLSRKQHKTMDGGLRPLLDLPQTPFHTPTKTSNRKVSEKTLIE